MPLPTVSRIDSNSAERSTGSWRFIGSAVTVRLLRAITSSKGEQHEHGHRSRSDGNRVEPWRCERENKAIGNGPKYGHDSSGAGDDSNAAT